jgi:hypothetical protein
MNDARDSSTGCNAMGKARRSSRNRATMLHVL